MLGFITACGGGTTQDVNVGLKEWSITPSAVQANAGKITFVAKNEGTVPHELMVVRTDLPVDALPVVDGKVNEDRVNIEDEIEPFGAGTTERKTVSLKSGRYVLICNIVERIPGQPVQSHYENGMRVAFTVN
ncbi:MAG TPA: hypothetical protein VJB57_11315 [Dehalococcoidia bacterium]|nr:hypothetical protein [Dehalococcoidia bacterium]